MIQFGLLGSHGRMGKWVSALLASDYSNRAALKVAANRGVDLNPLLQTDAIVDFSSPDATAELAAAAITKGGRLPVFVVGSTGWQPEQMSVLTMLAEKTPVLVSSNFSTGVLALQHILKTHSSLLMKLGYQPVMVETHHRHKKDAPSGTALLLNGTIQSSSQSGPIQTHSIRSGEVIGEHELTFYSSADKITLGHSAQDRSIFARGAIDAGIWLHEKRAQLNPKHILSMQEYFTGII